MSELLYTNIEEDKKINEDTMKIEVVLENKIKKDEIEIENYNKTNYNNLEKIRKQIESLNNVHHIEIAKILKNNNIKLTENNNG